ncbi:MAG: hypothetical protein GF400_00365 [Candidatus Eisenbacteria bacterium]|nr:hypothetical protein [Candidatus Eisenbacteria bacterium]
MTDLCIRLGGAEGGRRHGSLGRCLGPVALCAALICLSAASTGAVQWPWMRDEGPPSYPEITATADWVAARAGDGELVVLDGRPAAEYAAGHIPGAVSAPPGAIPIGPPSDLGKIAEAFASLGVTGRGQIVCCGASALDADAAALFWALEAAGAESPMLLAGGFEAWTSGGREVERDAVVLSPDTWTGSPRDERLASAAYVALKFGVDGHEIIDTRGWDTWSGERGEAGMDKGERRGHIPHALPYDFSEFLKADGSLGTPEETRETFSRTGPRPSSPVDLEDEFVVYGRGGAEGAVGYFLLRRAGVEKLRYFPGGWSQWGGDRSLPFVRIAGPDELLERVRRSRRWLRPDAPPEDFILFDVRHWGDHAVGHIPGAVALSSSFFADSLDVYLERHWPDADRTVTPVVTYCYGSNCIRSRNTATEAARQGFVHVERFYEGVEGWRLVGGELLRDEVRLEAMRREREEARRKAEARRAAESEERTREAAD